MAGEREWTRWEQDNRLRPNWAAFLAVALLVAAIVGLAVLFALLG